MGYDEEGYILEHIDISTCETCLGSSERIHRKSRSITFSRRTALKL
jgi:hypothetical protein